MAGTAGVAGKYLATGATQLSAGTSGSVEFRPISRTVAVSEVKFDPPGTDGNYEFVELRGQPETSLSGYWLAAIEGDAESNRGQLDVIVELANCGANVCLFDPSGRLLLVPDPAATVPPADVAWRLSGELAKGALENGTVSLLLLSGGVALSSGADWDVNDDGVLELPDTVQIVDAVAWTDGDTGDVVYATSILGPKPKAQAIWECLDSAGTREWRYGQLLGESPSLVVDTAHTVPAGLEPFVLTPGGDNKCQRILAAAGAPANAGTAASAGRMSTLANAGQAGVAGCGASTSVGGTSAASRGGASAITIGPSGVGGSHYGLGGATAATGAAGVASSLGGGGTATIPLGSQSTGGQRESVAGCGGVVPIVVVSAATNAAGRSGWWTPSPVVTSSSGQLTSSGGATTGVGSAHGSTLDAAAPPSMPTGCEVGKQSGSSSGAWWLLGMLGVAIGKPRNTLSRSKLVRKW